MKRLLFILSALFIASVAMAQTSREEIDAHPHIAMATHSVYAGGYFFKPLAEAPKGYKPFYISHYGRHGSRYEAEAEQTGDLLGIFRTAENSASSPQRVRRYWLLLYGTTSISEI